MTPIACRRLMLSCPVLLLLENPPIHGLVDFVSTLDCKILSSLTPADANQNIAICTGTCTGGEGSLRKCLKWPCCQGMFNSKLKMTSSLFLRFFFFLRGLARTLLSVASPEQNGPITLLPHHFYENTRDFAELTRTHVTKVSKLEYQAYHIFHCN